jgi:dUTP pyrophosphatase
VKKIKIQIKKLPGNEDLALPAYMTAHAAGMDVYAAVDGEVMVNPGQRALIPTGIAIALPPGFEAQIRPRSGLAIKQGIGILNAPGTIDADYRGEIKIIIINLGDQPFVVRRGDRIAQMVVHEVAAVEWQSADELPQSDRNAGGFGHTGK